jgi:hypothetical protein
MAGPYRRRQQFDSLLGELLATCDAFGRRHGSRGALVVFALFAVEFSPLGLVAGL